MLHIYDEDPRFGKTGSGDRAAGVPILGSSRRRPEANQGSPDPGGQVQAIESEQLAIVYGSSVAPLLGFMPSTSDFAEVESLG